MNMPTLRLTKTVYKRAMHLSVLRKLTKRGSDARRPFGTPDTFLVWLMTLSAFNMLLFGWRCHACAVKKWRVYVESGSVILDMARHGTSCSRLVRLASIAA